LPQSSSDSIVEGNRKLLRTTFAVDDVPALSAEKHAPDARQSQPGVRLFIEKLAGRPSRQFHDWFSYGKFIAERFKVPAIVMGPLKKFVNDAVGKNTEPFAALTQLQRAVDRSVEIVQRPAVVPGFPLQHGGRGLQEQNRLRRITRCSWPRVSRTEWTTELVLVNSYARPQAGKDVAFPGS